MTQPNYSPSTSTSIDPVTQIYSVLDKAKTDALELYKLHNAIENSKTILAEQERKYEVLKARLQETPYEVVAQQMSIERLKK